MPPLPVAAPLALILVFLALGGARLRGAETTVGPPATAPSAARDLKALEERVVGAIRKALPAVVAVNVTPAGRVAGGPDDHFEPAGSGVIIGRDGLILSQWHVSHVSRAAGRPDAPRAPGDVIDVALQDGRRLKAELLGADPVRDLSLLRIVDRGTYPSAELAGPDAVARGDRVVKLGHPFGYRPNRGATARLGRVLFTGASIEIVADCLTSGGDSGGPLVDLEGRVVGVAENASAPQLVIWSFPERCGTPLCYTGTGTIARLVPAMLGPARGPRPGPDLDVRSLPAHMALMRERRKELYGEVDAAVLAEPEWSQGGRTRSAWDGLSARYAGTVVEVLGRGRRVAYGTVVGADGWVLTKASEVPDDPRCRLAGGGVLPARVAGVDARYDVALLKVDARGIRPVRWGVGRVGPAGTLLAVPDGRGGTVGVGVVSVGRRGLEGPFPAAVTRAKPYAPRPVPPEVLGTPKMIEGVGMPVRRVKGAAARAGIVPGDVLVSLNGLPVRDPDADIDRAVEASAPGDRLAAVIERGGRRVAASIKLGEEPYVRCPGASARYRNLRADDFPTAFEHDVPLTLDECGGPVIDLDGTAVGMTIARVGQHGCMAIPADVLPGLVSRLGAE